MALKKGRTMLYYPDQLPAAPIPWRWLWSRIQAMLHPKAHPEGRS
jgi:hypothetical protein